MALAADHLVCPACLDVCDGHIHQCPQGHLICSECDRSLASRTCPTCRGALPSAEAPERNRFAERMIAALPYVCEHCGAATTRGERTAHEVECPGRPRVCAVRAYSASHCPLSSRSLARTRPNHWHHSSFPLSQAAWAGCGWTGLRAGQPEHEAACVYVSEVAPLKARLADLEPRAQHLQARGDAAVMPDRTLYPNDSNLWIALAPTRCRTRSCRRALRRWRRSRAASSPSRLGRCRAGQETPRPPPLQAWRRVRRVGARAAGGVRAATAAGGRGRGRRHI